MILLSLDKRSIYKIYKDNSDIGSGFLGCFSVLNSQESNSSRPGFSKRTTSDRVGGESSWP